MKRRNAPKRSLFFSDNFNMLFYLYCQVNKTGDNWENFPKSRYFLKKIETESERGKKKKTKFDTLTTVMIFLLTIMRGKKENNLVQMTSNILIIETIKNVLWHHWKEWNWHIKKD